MNKKIFKYGGTVTRRRNVNVTTAFKTPPYQYTTGASCVVYVPAPPPKSLPLLILKEEDTNPEKLTPDDCDGWWLQKQ